MNRGRTPRNASIHAKSIHLNISLRNESIYEYKCIQNSQERKYPNKEYE